MLRVLLSSALVVSLMACDGSGGTGPRTIGAQGGTVRADGVTLDVPAGALDRDVEIAVVPVALPSGYRGIGPDAFRFEPAGLRFEMPVTVRFDGSSAAAGATVFWSRESAADEFEALPTRIEGGAAIAAVQHFSIGFAGWSESETPDAGGQDGGTSDAGTMDAAVSDSGLEDAGRDAGAPTGITCVVREPDPDCTASVPVTHENVQFSFHPDSSAYGPTGALTSALAAFNTLYNDSGAIAFLGNASGTEYVVGPGDIANVFRAGTVLTVDIDVGRGGSVCEETGVPLILIRCTGSGTIAPLPAADCPLADTPPSDAISCAVTRRDGACVASTTTETPSFWLASGAHGPDSELRSAMPGLAEVFGAAGVATFYRELGCNTITPDLRDSIAGVRRVELTGSEVTAYNAFEGTSEATCRDSSSVARPLVSVSCSAGVAPLVAAP